MLFLPIIITLEVVIPILLLSPITSNLSEPLLTMLLLPTVTDCVISSSIILLVPVIMLPLVYEPVSLPLPNIILSPDFLIGLIGFTGFIGFIFKPNRLLLTFKNSHNVVSPFIGLKSIIDCSL